MNNIDELSKIEVKTCPFCGGEIRFIGYFKCDVCGAEVEFRKRDGQKFSILNHFTLWNRRAYE